MALYHAAGRRLVSSPLMSSRRRHWIEHGHNDLKKLNCVFTRVHWPQERRVLDYCDRHGILIQLEVPAWGPRTFEGMKNEPSAELLDNGLEQLREMIARDRNHPSVFAWGLCNEVNGQNPPAQQFVRALAREARRLDPHRLLTYASHSLRKTPERDVAGELDFISWNQYYESWVKGTVEDMRRNLLEIRAAFPSKPVVIAEYGYCECAPGRDAGDAGRIGILRRHTAVFRGYPWVAGLIFFCYNDYRTHIGDKGLGVMKQRVHGVVDLYGARKPSFEALRAESSPVEALHVAARPPAFEVRVRARGQLHRHVLAHHPLDVIGWDGYLYPWIFNIGDFEPITGRVHQPPPVHQTFEGWNFVVCSFVPRLFDYHPQAIPAPYAHSNVNSDEVIYYVDGNFMSRKGVEVGSFTLHPSGLPHGPHPGTMEASIGAQATQELAVMVDTFRPLQVAVQALEFEDDGYAYSWYTPA